MSRIYTQVGEDFDDYKKALVFIATVRGTPQLYYGTELLMTNPGTEDHGVIRSDFPGGWPRDPVNGFTGIGLTELQQEAQEFVRKLMQWRKGSTAVHSGKLMHFAPEAENEIYVLFRYTDSEKVMVILSNNDKDVTLDLGPYVEILGAELRGTAILKGQIFNRVRSVMVPANSAMIIEMEN